MTPVAPDDPPVVASFDRRTTPDPTIVASPIRFFAIEKLTLTPATNDDPSIKCKSASPVPLLEPFVDGNFRSPTFVAKTQESTGSCWRRETWKSDE
ncbi:hypothetical protein KM043_018017 [Ampulex compressa]|nr:hypothetical protein KM043_018017 [Ampulex compressa]